MVVLSEEMQTIAAVPEKEYCMKAGFRDHVLDY